MNPFDHKGTPLDMQTRSWAQLNVQPYDKHEVHPYTRCRIIVMNGTEFEANWFGHQFARHTDNIDHKRALAQMRRVEQQQQKQISGLVPADETVLEQTIGYEQVAVDLTAWLARHEPDPLVKAGLDFALLEDFDHLYRYANLLEMTQKVKAEDLVGEYTEIIPGRPTALEHRHPFDDVRMHYDASKAEMRTKINSMIILAGEQQTMNFYMNVANRADTHVGRGLYQEIAMVEEQHVTHYESLLDPTVSWHMRNCMHHYVEAYLYWSFMQQEPNPRIKAVWEENLEIEIGHLHASADMHRQADGMDVREVLGTFPEPMVFESNVGYVREILDEQVDWTAKDTDYVPTDSLPTDHRYFLHQKIVNSDGAPSNQVVQQHLDELGGEYRVEHPEARTHA